MNGNSFRTLEFEAIRALLLGHAGSAPGRRRIEALAPSGDPAAVREGLAVTSEGRTLLEKVGRQPYQDLPEVDGTLAKARIEGFLLEPLQLLDIASFTEGAGEIARVVARAEGAPRLSRLASEVRDASPLATAIRRAVLPSGELADDASPALLEIRRRIARLRLRLHSVMESYLRGKDADRLLQEKLITTRNDRYVLLVRAEQRGHLQGVVHGSSGSGASLFVEPMPAVELNNDIVALGEEERQEIVRILRDLSRRVFEAVSELQRASELLGELDAAQARALLAREMGASSPEIVTEPELELKDARHPLLEASFCERLGLPHRSTRSPVPVTLRIARQAPVLVISGPNTGGKTVALKTIGLLALMAQSGLHVPAAPGSRLPVFRRVFADIGDEQSIEQSLSTFSSHMTNIIDILQQADDRSLVLLDELGAGTDPIEGSALARALLTHLLRRNMTCLVATHYSELKVFAYNTESVRNASVEFDVETLSPTYRLTIGLPGRSNALAIAGRLGLGQDIVAEARASLSPTELEVEDMLEEIRVDRAAAGEARASAETAEQEVKSRARELEEKFAEIEAERRQVINAARQEAQKELEQLRSELQQLKRQAVQSEAIEEALGRIEKLEETTDELPPVTPPVVPDIDELRAGDRVWVNSLQREGELTELSEDEAEVQIGTFRARVPLHELEPRAQPERAAEQSKVRVSRPKPADVGMELDMRGQTVDEASLTLDKYLDDAYLAGLPRVQIIHGKGTGALRRYVREALDKHPLVAEYRRGDRHEGGDGVTVAKLEPK